MNQRAKPSLARRWAPLLRRHSHLVIFIVALALLTALGLTWMRFLQEMVELRYSLSVEQLVQKSRFLAVQHGHQKERPAAGTLPRDPDWEITAVAQAERGRAATALLPRWSELAVRPRPEVLDALAAKHNRQAFRVAGEGIMLITLLVVFFLLFYLLVRRERRLREENDVFLSMVTHELKTPITGVRALLQTIAMNRLPPAQQGEAVRLGLAQLNRLEHLVENMLIRHRLRQDRQQFAVAPLDLRAQVAKQLANRATATGVSDQIRLEDGPSPMVAADADALRVIVDNLLDNAIKYGKERWPIVVRITAAAGEAHLEVRDHGAGFEAAARERLFEPFWRHQSAGLAGHPGTGLGLTICRSLVGGMNGRLEASSPGPGQGSCFTLTLTSIQ